MRAASSSEAVILRAKAAWERAAVAAGFSSSSAVCSPQNAAHRTQGDLPHTPTLPQRSLLLRKLVEFQRACQPPGQAHDQPVSTRQQARAARQAAAQQHLAAVLAAAARQDISTLLQQLAAGALLQQQPAAVGQDGKSAAGLAEPSITSSSSSSSSSSVWIDPGVARSLQSTAAALAASQLAAASGRPEPAQAFVEMATERGLLQPHQLARAVHAVLQAYADKGDHRAVLAVASRFYDTGGGSSLLPPGFRPSSCTLALLLQSAAATRDADLVMGVWRYFGGSSSSSSSSGADEQQQQQQPQQLLRRRQRRRCGSSLRDVLPEQNVLHAFVHGSILCDLASAGLASSSSSSSSSSGLSFAAAPVVAAAADTAAGDAAASGGGVAAALFHSDSTTVEGLRELQLRVAAFQSRQQQRQQQWRPQQQQLPVALLHPRQAAQLLQHTCSASDVDVLLLSQLYQPTGLAVEDVLKLSKKLRQQQQQQQQQQNDHGSAAAAPGRPAADPALSQSPLSLLPQLKPDALPRFPPALRSDVARAAVAAYVQHGAFARAAAVAHVAAVAHPRDAQQFQLLINSCAAAGKLLPALVTMTKMRESLWQAAAPKAQAAMLRSLARAGAGPPLGAAPSSSRLLTFFSKHCSPHPKTWGALLQGLVVTGDSGGKLLRALQAALVQPYSYMGMTAFTPQQLDRARSNIVAALLRGILAAPAHSSRLAALLDCTAAAAAAHNSSGSSSKQQRRLLRQLAPAASSSSLLLTGQQQQQQRQLGLSGVPQQALPGLLLQQQPVHTRSQVLLLLAVFDLLAAWGVTLRHDAALAAALQVLRFCCDTEDARSSGLLVAVLRAAMGLGIRPAAASLRALLSCCADLESRPGKVPLGSAAGPGLLLEGAGHVDLALVIRACEEAVVQQQLQSGQRQAPTAGDPSMLAGSSTDAAAAGSGGSPSSSISSSSSSNMEVQRLAADLLRTWAFHGTFDCVEQLMLRGPMAVKQQAAGSIPL